MILVVRSWFFTHPRSRIRNTDKKGRLNIPSLERERLLSELSELLSLLLELELLLLELLCFLFFLAAAALSLAAGRPFLFSSSLLLLLLLLLQRMKFLVRIFWPRFLFSVHELEFFYFFFCEILSRGFFLQIIFKIYLTFNLGQWSRQAKIGPEKRKKLLISYLKSLKILGRYRRDLKRHTGRVCIGFLKKFCQNKSWSGSGSSSDP